jgi:hypothetical protein
MGFQKAINARFRDEVALCVGEGHGQLPGRQLRLVQGQVHNLAADVVRDPVPHPTGTAGTILETGLANGPVAVVPSVKRRCRNAELIQGAADRQVGAFDQADDLQLLGCWVSHAPSPPSPVMLFFSSRFSSICSASASLRSRISRRRSLTSPEEAWRAVSPANLFLPASRNSFDQL